MKNRAAGNDIELYLHSVIRKSSNQEKHRRMKKIMVLLVAAFMTTSLFAQKLSPGKVPQVVRKAFSKEFPKGAGASWTLQPDSIYQVSFQISTQKNTARFDKTGKWLEKKAALTEKELPKPVKSGLKKEFKGFDIMEAWQDDTPDKGIQYKLLVNKKGEAYNVLFSPTGELLDKQLKEPDIHQEVPHKK
jgi:hypothetical protein